MEEVRSSQHCTSINSCAELSKKQIISVWVSLIWHGVKVGPGPRDPGPPQSLKVGPQGPLQKLKVRPP